MQVVLKIYVYYNDKLFGIFQWFHKNQISCLDGLIVSPVRSTYGGYYGLVGVPPPRPPRPPRPQTLHRSHDNLKNPYRIASIFYM